MLGRSLLGGMILAASSLAAFGQEPSGTAAGLTSALDADLGDLWQDADYKPGGVDDATFLRRAYLDLVGTLPSVSAARDFLNDPSAEKRARLVDRLLADERSADHIARVWRRIIVPAGVNDRAGQPLEPWLAERFEENARFDDIVKRLVTGSYEGDQTAAAAFRQVAGGGPADIANSTSRIFLGVRIGCARCHDHPFADWKQSDFWGMAAFFTEEGGNGSSIPITAENGTTYQSRFLGESVDAEIPNGRRPADVFADWMTSEANPYFAATVVNRVWEQLVGRGLVTPVEDLDMAHPQDRQAVLDKLAARFADSDYDLRTLLAAICNSRAYQSAGPRAEADVQGARPLKVLAPEQVFASLEQALMLPVSRFDGSPRYDGGREAFVRRLDEAAGESPADFQAGVPQALMMMNGRITGAAVDLEGSRTLRAVVEAPFLGPADKIETLYLAALTRKPRPDELEIMLRHVESSDDSDGHFRAYAEIFWAILNSPEFVLCR